MRKAFLDGNITPDLSNSKVAIPCCELEIRRMWQMKTEVIPVDPEVFPVRLVQ